MRTFPLILVLFGSLFMILAGLGYGEDDPHAAERGPKMNKFGGQVRRWKFRPQWLGVGCLLLSIAVQLGYLFRVN